MEVLAVVLARAGSERLPNKNLRNVGGVSLVAKACEDAFCAAQVHRVVCSTDSDKIAAEARAHAAQTPFLRPTELATADASSHAVEAHVLDWLREHEGWEPDILVRVQPTSPLRTPADIDATVLKLKNGAKACVSVCPVEEHPYTMCTLGHRDALHRLYDRPLWHQPSQLYPDIYRVNGAVYAARVSYWRENRGYFGERTVGYVMPRERSVDVDTLDDLREARRLHDEHALTGKHAAGAFWRRCVE